jgi:heme exporter protein B
MIPIRQSISSLWWLIHKDLTRELRAQHVWPGMVLLGLVLVFLLATQIDLPLDQKVRVGGGLLWLAVYFAGTLACDRSFTGEREAGCWQALTLYPIAPSVLFLAKMAVNLAALGILELVLVPVFIILSDVPFASRPGPLLLITALGNVGFAAVGTLVSGLTSGLRQRGGLLTLLVLPLVAPVVLGAAEATRLLLSGQIDSLWWRWIQLLAVFAAVFTVAGAMLFEFVVED